MKIFKWNVLFFLLLSTVYYLLTTSQTRALSFDIQAPTGTLTRNQDYDFTVTIDTQGQQLSNTMADVTYDSTVLQFVSVTNGNFFTGISYTQPDSTHVRLSGTNTAAKSGAGTFAIVKFKIIAASPGSTTLCTVEPVAPTPTPAPTTVVLQCSVACTATSQCAAGLSCIGGMCRNPSCSEVVSCSCPIPTRIPQAGALSWQTGSLIALGLIAIGVFGMLIL